MDADTDPAATATEWLRVLDCCRDEVPIGFGLLDSFLDGPDLHRRIDLVVSEATTNPWLRLELRDTLSLNQSGLSDAQLARLVRIASDT